MRKSNCASSSLSQPLTALANMPSTYFTFVTVRYTSLDFLTFRIRRLCPQPLASLCSASQNPCASATTRSDSSSSKSPAQGPEVASSVMSKVTRDLAHASMIGPRGAQMPCTVR